MSAKSCGLPAIFFISTRCSREATGTTISPSDTRTWREVFFEQFGKPSERPDFWDAISATSYLRDLSGPLQLHHARPDPLVPTHLADQLVTRMQAINGAIEAHFYENDDHNLYANFDTAMRRTIQFLGKYAGSG